jgi:hypothetical protein
MILSLSVTGSFVLISMYPCNSSALSHQHSGFLLVSTGLNHFPLVVFDNRDFFGSEIECDKNCDGLSFWLIIRYIECEVGKKFQYKTCYELQRHKRIAIV